MTRRTLHICVLAVALASVLAASGVLPFAQAGTLGPALSLRAPAGELEVGVAGRVADAAAVAGAAARPVQAAGCAADTLS